MVTEFALSLVVFGSGDAGMPKIDPFYTPRLNYLVCETGFTGLNRSNRCPCPILLLNWYLEVNARSIRC